MKVIQVLSDKITDEIKDAKSYMKLAMAYHEDYPELSRTLYSIASQEIDHMNMIHDEVVTIIKKYRAEHGEPPADMMAVYEYLHKRQLEHYAKVKSLMDAYKNA